VTSAQTDIATASGAHAYPLQRHYIDGAFREAASGRTFVSLDPATNQPIAAAADGAAQDVDLAVSAARRAFDEGPWPRVKAAERAAILCKIGAIIRERSEEFVEREVRDIGMPIAQMRGLATRAATNFEYYAGVVTELHGRSFQVGDEFLNYTIRKPVGASRRRWRRATPWSSSRPSGRR
jgi:5-carboxymethyl-2-hydroxymuconic-semialdehyde dehydrogenase